MRKTFIALAAALLASPAWSNTLIDHINGIQVGRGGELQHFDRLLIGDDGKVIRTLTGLDGERLNVQKRIDGGGRTLLPGLIDAHGHVMDLGFAALRLDLAGTSSLADLQQRLRDYAAAHLDAKWIIGFGWNQELWPEKRFPTAADLDAVVADRPVVLERVDGHAIVANSVALKAAGVTAATQAPAGGRIENGLFVDAARNLIDPSIPKSTHAEMDRALAKAQEILLGFGVTGVGSMSTSLADWAAFRRAADSGRLQVRLMTYMTASDAAQSDQRPTGWLYADRLRLVGVKLFADGALGSRGAWLKQPYADKPDTRGLQFHSDAEMMNLANQAAAVGFQIATHAIGDAANAQVITVYETLSKKYGKDRRWRIEHFQIVDPADIPRLAPAGNHCVDAADSSDERPANGGEAARARSAKRRLCLADGPQERGSSGVRDGFSGGVAESVPGAFSRNQPAGRQWPAAGRMDSGGTADVRASARRLHARRGLCRLCGGQSRQP